jgi:pyrroline-5-carboxylate reductase
MNQYELGVIGAGNMATAILRGILDAGLMPPEAVIAFDPSEERQGVMREELGIACAPGSGVAASCPYVLLGVKPMVMEAVLAEIASSVREDAVVISVAAGITSAFLDEGLGGRGRIVRVMPNTPMLVGKGMSALAAGPRATGADMARVEQLFAAGGSAVVVQERDLDAVTGLSGSGPAYLFYLAEAMAEAGVATGLSPEVASLLATQTCAGAGALLAQSGKSPGELRKMVTTPGGTTEAAITHMEEAGLPAIVVEAIKKAAARSRELGR